ncbi:DUF481 domain-containing protein [Mangrovibacterium diazotrophicum]|uniref:Uncharacterized protein DUF481 n=1 Tax=Mangrovibacterium diazotrophicum TaxID=1261403 RepID=A0A419W7K3_9BACT|nr:DUF481 domain-containing protein [Mangrovibacterium diazotrophicum]RKD91444.1 uncharacterized protein DUF481 [Mangrovibacterium diazotrophicum]
MVKKIIFLFLFGCSTIFVSAQQDTLISSTGDVIIGEIKSLSRNVLSFDTDYADSEFQVDWNEVKGLVSAEPLVIYVTGGKKYTGRMRYDASDQKVKITGDDIDMSVDLHDVVKINTTNDKFWDKVYISLDAGYSYTKANNLSQFSMTGQVKYTEDNWKLSAGFNNVATRQDEVGTTKRDEANIDFNRDIYGNAYAFAGMEFLSSSEQNLDLRTTSKLGVGYYFIRENGMYLQGGLGLANAHEQYGSPDNISKNSFEGLMGFEFDAYDTGDFSFRLKSTAYPSFSNKGRWRINTDVSAKWDLPLDFYIKASFVHNFDSKPQVDNVDKGDYVFQTSIGWEWD